LALPLPPLLPSVNQIGFDSYDMIAGTIARVPSGSGSAGRLLVWVVGARPGARGGVLADPAGNFQFPLEGPYRGDSLALSSNGLSLQFSFGPVPLRRFDFRGSMGAGLRMGPGAGLYSETLCSDVPNYSAQLHVAGVCNAQDTLAASGTMLTRRYQLGTANRRPRGVHVASLELTRPAGGADGLAVARLRLAPGARYPARAHVGSILLTGRRGGAVVPLDYRADTSAQADAAGDLRTIRLRIPAGTGLPPKIRAYVITDVFPLATRDLD
jgi:hypothetical protein